MSPRTPTPLRPDVGPGTVAASARLVTRTDDGRVRWAVVAANGRVLGMSAGRFGSIREAHEDFRGLCGLLAGLPVSFGRQVGARDWRWRVGDTERGHVAVSAQSYERHATARAAYARFVRTAALLCAN